jgi:hypothetical protein
VVEMRVRPRNARIGSLRAAPPIGLALVLGGMLLASSCRSQPGSPTPTAMLQTVVRVVNRNFLDMDIYALVSGEPMRVGTVTGLSTQVLPLPAGVVQTSTEVQFRADPVGGRQTAVSVGVYANPGDTLQLEIPSGPF